MAYYLINRLDTPAYIPDNYIHAFLLRDPHKSVYSLYKMSLNKDLTGNRPLCTYLLYRQTYRKKPYVLSCLCCENFAPIWQIQREKTRYLAT